MFGPFRLTNPLSGGLLWKIPWRLSRHQKYRQRERLRHVDTVVGTIDTALRRMGQSMKKVERWKMEMPTEAEMLPKDKYTVFDRKVKRYRKGIHRKDSEILVVGRNIMLAIADISQRYQNGRESVNDSTLRVSRQTTPGTTVALQVLELLKANTITVQAYAQSLLDRIHDRDDIVKAWAHLALHLSKRQIKSLFYAELENLIMCHKIREDRCMEWR
ncbi:hypothetical protein J4E89_001331 [Alternaria sp. Ai002NY15]|nr:hypothetical protein J4E89_001331 [Alternaria sp. Ai002NY15]